jgi:hypothetical protein
LRPHGSDSLFRSPDPGRKFVIRNGPQEGEFRINPAPAANIVLAAPAIIRNGDSSAHP